jgi:hypothetical protein
MIFVKPPGITSSAAYRDISIKILKSGISIDPAPDIVVDILISTTLINIDLVINSGNIINAGTVNDIIIENHVNRHNFSGSDPLQVGLISNISENSYEGTSDDIPRADHVHAHGNLAGDTLHAEATTTTSGFMSSSDKTKINNFGASDADPENIGISSPGISYNYSRADHVHSHGNQPGGALHDDATTTTSGFMSISDKIKINNFGASDSDPENIGISSPGISYNYSRADHVHAHGNQPGGTLHAEATTTTTGFMSSSDKITLNSVSWDNITENLTVPFGTITVPNQAYGYAAAGANQTIPSGIETHVTNFTLQVRKISTGYNFTGIWTINVPGMYFLYAFPDFRFNSSGIRYGYILKTRGLVETKLGFSIGFASSLGNTTLLMTSISLMEQFDTIKCFVYQNSGSNLDLENNELRQVFFSVKKLY